MTSINTALVGLGRWGKVLFEAARATDSINITHVVTRTPGKAEKFCRDEGLKLSDDFSEVLDNDEIDAVIIATPHTQHFSQLLLCAGAGKHVYCEKPFTLTGDEATKALGALAANHCKVAIGHNRRFAPNTLALQEILAKDDLGDPVHVEGVFNANMDAARGKWRDSVDESPAGGMTSLGIHALDMMINLMGNVAEIRAASRRVAATLAFDDYTVVDLLFDNNAGGRLTTLTSTAMQWRITWYGTRGWAELRDLDTLIVQPVDGERTETHYPGFDYPATASITAALAAFATDISGGAPYPVSPTEIAHATAALEAIVESAASGQPIAL